MGVPQPGWGGMSLGGLLLTTLDLCLVSGLSLEPVYWNTANKRFQAEGGYVIYPQIGDRLDLLCPRARPPGPHSSPDYEFYKLYLVGAAQGRRCQAPPAPNLLLTCDRPDLDLRFTIKFQEYSPNLWGHEFRSNQDYYIIATSDGTREGLESLQGGVCLTRGMKVLLRVGQNPRVGNAPRKPISETLGERGSSPGTVPGKENPAGGPSGNVTGGGADGGALAAPSLAAVAGAAGGAALLLLGAAGAGGALCWRRRRAKPSETRHPDPPPARGSGRGGIGGTIIGGSSIIGGSGAEPGELGIPLRGAGDPPFCPHYEKVSGDYGHPVYIVQDGPPQSPANIYYKV
ncbi:ephrin-B3 [Tachyglossus aculeatus]|uniref:ephrin-B3 n=1 Tax=Tachyglossus aculeatus TaxID=9261 RepID=UPI0018F4DC7B|nr:ephrin-B3 [Tachyglossus aculeatus]